MCPLYNNYIAFKLKKILNVICLFLSLYNPDNNIIFDFHTIITIAYNCIVKWFGTDICYSGLLCRMYIRRNKFKKLSKIHENVEM